MRYFTKELWSRINETDATVQLQAEQEWHKNSLVYQQEFEKAKKHLPNEFVQDFLFRKGLHDYTIMGIAIAKREHAYSCELQLTDALETVLITMFGLRSFRIDVDSLQHSMHGELVWGYSEFEIVSENSIQLAVLCDMQNEIQFEFETIKLTKQ